MEVRGPVVRLVDAVIIGMGYVGLPLAREATTTPLPLAADLVRSENIGLVVPWDDPGAVVEAILKLRAEPELRSQLGGNGHKVANATTTGATSPPTSYKSWTGSPIDSATTHRLADSKLP